MDLQTLVKTARREGKIVAVDKLYVVANDNYIRDYIAYFSKKEEAELFVEILKKQKFDAPFDERFVVQQLNIDYYSKFLGKDKQWFFFRMKKNGEVYDRCGTNTYLIKDCIPFGFDVNGHMHCNLLTSSFEEAVEIAHKKRIQLINEDKWNKKPYIS